MSAVKYLQDKEWSMGNGQCPECCGAPDSWHGHPCHMTTESIGHELDCSLAASLSDLGVTPLMKGEYISDVEYEHYITDSGCFSTRPKTKDGCAKWKAYSEKMNKSLSDTFGDMLSKEILEP